MDTLLDSVVPVVGVGLAVLVGASAAILMFSVEAWVADRFVKGATASARLPSTAARRR